MIRYLSRGEVEALDVTGPAIADAIETCLRAAASGALVNLPKSGASLDDGRLFQSVMAVGTGEGAPAYAATKIVGLSPENHARGLPHIAGVIVLQDAVTGAPLSVIDASWITEFRTAALSLVAARRLARADAATIGFVGCGAQARSHLAVLGEQFPLRRVRAFSRRRTTAESFAADCAKAGFEARALDTARDAVSGCDIVVTTVPANSGEMAYLDPDWLDAGGFAALVDLGRSWKPEGFERFDHRVVDDHAQAAKSKRPLTPSGPFTADLKALVTGEAKTRRSGAERAVFVFQGLALADLAAAAIVYERATARDAGVLLAP